MFRLVIMAAFFLHGMAHLSGFFASWTTARQDSRSSLGFYRVASRCTVAWGVSSG